MLKTGKHFNISTIILRQERLWLSLAGWMMQYRRQTLLLRNTSALCRLKLWVTTPMILPYIISIIIC